MGFLNRKRKLVIAKLVHYEGLSNIPQNYGLNVIIEGSNLIFRQVKMDISATLSIDKIVTCENLKENDYLAKYKNTTITERNELYRQKMYWVISYTSNNQEINRLVFWNALGDNSKMANLVKQINTAFPKEDVIL